MRMYDLINKKKHGEELTAEEIKFMVDGYVSEEIPDYQMSAMLMAIYFQGMTDKEVFALTDAMAKSGDMVDLSSIDGIKVDKHTNDSIQNIGQLCQKFQLLSTQFFAFEGNQLCLLESTIFQLVLTFSFANVISKMFHVKEASSGNVHFFSNTFFI